MQREQLVRLPILSAARMPLASAPDVKRREHKCRQTVTFSRQRCQANISFATEIACSVSSGTLIDAGDLARRWLGHRRSEHADIERLDAAAKRVAVEAQELGGADLVAAGGGERG